MLTNDRLWPKADMRTYSSAADASRVGCQRPAVTGNLEHVYLGRSHVLAGLLLHCKAVKQTVTTRADQCSLAATPGVMS